MTKFADAQWAAVETIIGTSRPSAREDIEWLGNLYARHPRPEDERARYADEIARMQSISDGIRNLKAVIETAGWGDNAWSHSFVTMTKSMDEVTEELAEDIAHLNASRPKTRTDRARTWFLNALCLYWFYALKRTERGGTINGQPSSPLYSFLMAATEPWFRGRLPLTIEMASHAASEYRGQKRTSAKKVEPPIDPAMFYGCRLPDEFDLVIAFDESKANYMA